jgi:ABC-type antimicrobial peptide transport system permease subunit
MKSPKDTVLPRLPHRLLKWFCSPDLIEDVEGDLAELFAQRAAQSRAKARAMLWLDVLLLFRPGIIRKIKFNNGQNSVNMINNYFKIALRNALRYKGYTLLNLLGLVVGIASSMLVLLWIQDERSIDKFHEKGDEIYRVFRNMKQSNGMVSTTTAMPKPLADLVEAEYSEIEEVAELSWSMDLRMTLDDQTTEETGHFANPEFLEMFSFPLLLGDKSLVLGELNSIVISRAVAERFFGENWKNEALGSIFTLEDGNVAVSGVFENIGDNSSITFDWLRPAQLFYNQNRWVDNWGNGSFGMFVTIADEAKAAQVADRIRMEIMDHTTDNDMAGDEEVIIYKFQDTYLNSKFENGVISGGRIDYVRIMTVVAIFILIVACINFMNLTTARSSRRSKEIGLRKVMGAGKKSIGYQFFFEALLLTTIAVAVSVLSVTLLLPYFNGLVDKSLSINLTEPLTWYFLTGLIVCVGGLSGSYPALLLPTFNIIQSLKGGVKQSSYATFFRKGLVVFQFAISTLLIIGTAVVYKQIDFVLNKDLGLEKENLVAIPLQGQMVQKLETYKNELLRIPEISAVTSSSGNPLNYGRSTSSASWEGKDPSAGYEVNVLLTDRDFVKTNGMEILKGRDFSEELQDSTRFLVNEVAASMMGFEDPIGKDLSFWGIRGQIIGVVKNFHMRNLYEPIAPLIITCVDPSLATVMLVRVSGDTGNALRAMEAVTTELNPGFDFSYRFLDEVYAEGYRGEQTVGKLANIFAFISILISSLGLLGLTSYSAEQRSMEIGVRKVHGASVMQILVMLSKDYSRLILLSFILAIPVGYYVMQGWLSDFEFRTTLGPFVFVIAALVTFLTGVLTVGAKSYQAAAANPVKSLRQE